MPKVEVNAVLYAVDLEEIRAWIGCRDERRFKEAWQAVLDTEDADWEPQELEVLERLLRRIIFEGQLYDGLNQDERYYLTQLLIDLFDEFVDQDPLTEDIPLDGLTDAVSSLPANSEAARMAAWLVRGRELNGEGLLWQEGPVEEVLSYLGYVRREEAPRLLAALDEALGKSRTRPSGALKQLRSAVEECARAELDLLSFVG